MVHALYYSSPIMENLNRRGSHRIDLLLMYFYDEMAICVYIAWWWLGQPQTKKYSGVDDTRVFVGSGLI